MKWFILEKIYQVKLTITPHHIPSAAGAKGDPTPNNALWIFLTKANELFYFTYITFVNAW